MLHFFAYIIDNFITSSYAYLRTVMENTLNITTFNTLNNPERKEERVELLFQELKDHGSDIALLQEVLEETFPLIQAKAAQDGWHITKGSLFTHNKKASGNVTLSRTPIQSSFSLPSPDPNLNQVDSLITHHGNNVTTINSHLPWGGNTEQHRLANAYLINKYAESLLDHEPERIVIMGGDLNAELTSSTLRYLKGELVYKETSTFWTNSWDVAENTFPTARKDGGWAESTANSVGIKRPELMPDRTIDHILTYGWNYGKKASPLTVRKFGELNLSNGYGLSDHYGITVEIVL